MTCVACGEYWPCSVERNKGAYRADVATAHRPDTREADRRNPKTQGWWLTGVLSRERRSGVDRRKA